MTSQAATVEDYLQAIPDQQRDAVHQLRQTILDHLPKGFEERMNYGMIGYVVPHSRYPAGYHCDPKLPLPFLALAAQKNSVNFYHMGIYARPDLLDWFTKTYAATVPGKLDMGKSCIRFKKPENIPHDLIGQLMEKMTVEDWIATYEQHLRR